MKYKDDFLWKLFFFNSGLTGVITYNSMLSTGEFVIKNTQNNNILPFLTFGYSAGLILSFFLGEKIFGRFLLIKKTMITTLLIFISYLVFMLYIMCNINNLYINTIVVTILVFINGFCTSSYQSFSIGLASCISFKELQYVNQGNGLIAVITNGIVLILYSQGEKFRQSRLFASIYIFIILLYIFYFYFISNKFFRKYEILISKKLHKKTSELVNINDIGKYKVNIIKTIKVNLDLILGIIFCYMNTLIIYPGLFFKYKDFDKLFLIQRPLLQILKCTSDFIPRFLPPTLIFKNKYLIHIYNILRIILIMILIILCVNINFFFDKLIYSYIFIGIVLIINSFTNGHLTMSFFKVSTDRLNTSDEKNFAGRSILFGLYFGILYGSFWSIVSLIN